jgi:hypothetical protein
MTLKISRSMQQKWAKIEYLQSCHPNLCMMTFTLTRPSLKIYWQIRSLRLTMTKLVRHICLYRQSVKSHKTCIRWSRNIFLQTVKQYLQLITLRSSCANFWKLSWHQRQANSIWLYVQWMKWLSHWQTIAQTYALAIVNIYALAPLVRYDCNVQMHISGNATVYVV